MIPRSLYEQFRRWFQQKYGWVQSLAIPSNKPGINFNPYFHSFLEESNLWVAAPAARQAYEVAQRKAQTEKPLMYDQPSMAYFTPPATKTPGENLPVVKSVGGRDWMWTPDISGTGGMWTHIGETPPTGEMTPYQREQLGLQRTELGQRQADIMNQREMLGVTRMQQALDFERQRLNKWGQGSEGAAYRTQQNVLADQFEQMRQLAAGVTSPRNWVQQAYAAAGEGEYANPFRMPEETWEETSKHIKGEVQSLKSAETEAKKTWQSLANRVADEIPNNNPTQEELASASYRYNELKAMRQTAEKVFTERQEEETDGTAAWGQMIAESVGETGGGVSPRKPFVPAIPSDIQKFLEKPVFGSKVIRPSGQQWAATPWSEREKLFGYLESQKQYPIEMLEQMAMELPREPSLGRRWTAARQMV